jgi:ElaB/YqjD/DUF883 family membrane-anchored ribosome-binding protein
MSDISGSEEAKRRLGALGKDVGNGLHATQEALKKGVEQSKARINEAIDVTADRVDQAHMYLKQQARERPIALTMTAIGAGLVLGMLLAGGRRR